MQTKFAHLHPVLPLGTLPHPTRPEPSKLNLGTFVPGAVPGMEYQVPGTWYIISRPRGPPDTLMSRISTYYR